MKRSSYRQYLLSTSPVPRQTVHNTFRKRAKIETVENREANVEEHSFHWQNPSGVIGREFMDDSVDAEVTELECVTPSIKETVLLIYAYSRRHNLTKMAVGDLLQLLRVLTPGSSELPSTYKSFKDVLNFDYTGLRRNVYCPKCQTHFINSKCAKCNTSFQVDNLLKGGSFFLTNNIEKVLSLCVQNEEVASNLKSQFRIRKTAAGNGQLGSMMDGNSYKSLDINSSFDFTCTLNFDGAPVFKSSSFSIHPILFTINELSTPLKRKFVRMLALWFGKEKPVFNTILLKLRDEMMNLATTGFQWKLSPTEVITSRVFFTCFAADSIARPMVQGIKQFNGHHGCPFCLHSGEFVQFEKPKNKIGQKFVYKPQSLKQIKEKARSHAEFLCHLEILKKKLVSGEGSSFMGINRRSRMVEIPKFDIINGFTFDYMHTCLLGVTRMFANVWFDTQYHRKHFYLGKHVIKFNKFLKRCRVPSTTNRILTTIQERAFWKANQWRTWNLICPIILDEFMPTDIGTHFKKYLKALYMMSSTTPSSDEVATAEKLMYSFVRGIPKHYGTSFCTFNSHLLLHAAECVRNWGPLYGYSLFQFENYNGMLLKLFHGTQHVALQMMTAAMEISEVANQEHHLKNSAVRSMYGRFLSTSFSSDVVQALGELQHPLDNDTISRICEFLGRTVSDSSLKVFKRLSFHGICFCSSAYDTKGRSNSVFKTNNNEFCQIEYLIQCDNLLLVSFKQLMVTSLFKNIFEVTKVSSSVSIVN